MVVDILQPLSGFENCEEAAREVVSVLSDAQFH